MGGEEFGQTFNEIAVVARLMFVDLFQSYNSNYPGEYRWSWNGVAIV